MLKNGTFSLIFYPINSKKVCYSWSNALKHQRLSKCAALASKSDCRKAIGEILSYQAVHIKAAGLP